MPAGPLAPALPVGATSDQLGRLEWYDNRHGNSASAESTDPMRDETIIMPTFSHLRSPGLTAAPKKSADRPRPVNLALSLLIVGTLSLSPLGTIADAQPVPAMKRVELPKMAPPELKPYAKLEIPANIEPSGLVKSRLWKDLFWAHNDSGDLPRVFAVRRDGTIYPSERYGAAHGVHIPDAVNVDWEDIATDDQGNLVIADFGNSEQNDRRDLCLYFIFEPHPSVGQTSVQRKVFFAYPDQEQIPSPISNFDAEALFFADGKFYILTKHRADTGTTLYRLDNLEPYKTNLLTRIDSFDTQGEVTGADASADGLRLAVLTYTGVWLFDAREPGRWFDGEIRWLPLEDGDQEAITIDGDNLIISAGEGDGYLFEIPIASLRLVKANTRPESAPPSPAAERQ
ncbi:MAG: hypothetical protein U0795_18795 [Pirellulales bacterium]